MVLCSSVLGFYNVSKLLFHDPGRRHKISGSEPSTLLVMAQKETHISAGVCQISWSSKSQKDNVNQLRIGNVMDFSSAQRMLIQEQVLLFHEAVSKATFYHGHSVISPGCSLKRNPKKLHTYRGVRPCILAIYNRACGNVKTPWCTLLKLQIRKYLDVLND